MKNKTLTKSPKSKPDLGFLGNSNSNNVFQKNIADLGADFSNTMKINSTKVDDAKERERKNMDILLSVDDFSSSETEQKKSTFGKNFFFKTQPVKNPKQNKQDKMKDYYAMQKQVRKMEKLNLKGATEAKFFTHRANKPDTK